MSELRIGLLAVDARAGAGVELLVARARASLAAVVVETDATSAATMDALVIAAMIDEPSDEAKLADVLARLATARRRALVAIAVWGRIASTFAQSTGRPDLVIAGAAAPPAEALAERLLEVLPSVPRVPTGPMSGRIADLFAFEEGVSEPEREDEGQRGLDRAFLLASALRLARHVRVVLEAKAAARIEEVEAERDARIAALEAGSEAAIRALSSEQAATAAARDAADARVSELTSALLAQAETLAAEQAANAALMAARTAVERELQSTEAKLAVSEIALEEAAERAETAEARVAALEMSLGLVETELADARAEHRRKLEEVERDASRVLAEALRERDALRRDLASERSDLERTAQALTRCEKDVVARDEMVAALTDSVASLELVARSLRDDVGALREELRYADASLAQASRDLSERREREMALEQRFALRTRLHGAVVESLLRDAREARAELARAHHDLVALELREYLADLPPVVGADVIAAPKPLATEGALATEDADASTPTIPIRPKIRKIVVRRRVPDSAIVESDAAPSLERRHTRPLPDPMLTAPTVAGER